MPRFSEISVSDRAELSHTVTQADIDRFVELTGDDNRLHVDGDYASQTVLRKPVVHGMLGASFISTVIGTKLPGDGALWFSQNLEFLLPVHVGDDLRITAEVIRKQKNAPIIELQTDIFNQHGAKVTSGTAKVKIVEPEVAQISPVPKNQRKVAIVVGGTGGIGRATCLRLATERYDVVVCYHTNKQLATGLVAEIESMGCRAVCAVGDITERKAAEEIVDKAVRHFGGVSVLINCSSTPIPQIRFEDLTWEDVQRQIDVGIKGILNLVQCVTPVMEREKRGRIITLLTQAIENPSSKWIHYITAKAGLSGFSRSLAVELAPKGIRVNMVSPGMTDTALVADLPEKARQLAATRAPLRRLATPDDVAGAICFLASDEADFITGETLRVNGGSLMI